MISNICFPLVFKSKTNSTRPTTIYLYPNKLIQILESLWNTCKLQDKNNKCEGTFYFYLSRDIVDARYHLFSSQSSFCLLLYLFNAMQFVSPGNITEESQNTQKDDDLVNTARIVYSQKGIAF